MIGTLATVETYLAYNLLTLFCCASLLPLALTKASPPITKAAPRLRPLLALSRSPLAVSAVIVTGLTSAAYRMVGPIYGSELGLNASQIGLFLAGYVLGGAISQYPSGWLADKYDRRWVVISLSLASLASCTISFFAVGVTQIIAASCLFGFITVPIYSVATAHAHDFAASDERVELSAALLFYFAVGAIASPIIAALLIQDLAPAPSSSSLRQRIFYWPSSVDCACCLGMWPYLRQLTYILPEHPFWWAASQKDCAILALLSSLRAWAFRQHRVN